MIILFFIIGLLISATFYGLIGGIALKLAYRLFFKQHSMVYMDAFKLMFIAGLFAFGSSLMLGLAGINEGPISYILPMLVNFAVVTFVLLKWEGLTIGQSAAVGAITSVFFLLIEIALIVLVVGAAIGVGAAAGV